jgi:ferredoxin
MKFKLEKRDFKPFLQSLIDGYDLYAPVHLAEGVPVYRKMGRPDEVDLSLLNPQKSLKEVFFPQDEVMFRYEKVDQETQMVSTEEVKRERVVLGARPCDIEAISIIEEVFSGREYTDIYFLNKRKATMIIGMACHQPLPTCFCSSTGGGPFVRKGSDLFLIDLGEAYLVEILTEKGEAFKKNKFFKKTSAKNLQLAKELEEKASKKTDSTIPVKGIDQKLDQWVESPFWDRVHEKCISCRVCTYLCPTCHCFDIMDEALNEKGQRVRNWDSCLSEFYTLETSGHNPRATCRERTRQRLMHKFNYFPKVFDRIACVGCGRCILYCPVNFDIREVIKEINAK